MSQSRSAIDPVRPWLVIRFETLDGRAHGGDPVLEGASMLESVCRRLGIDDCNMIIDNDNGYALIRSGENQPNRAIGLDRIPGITIVGSTTDRDAKSFRLKLDARREAAARLHPHLHVGSRVEIRVGLYQGMRCVIMSVSECRRWATVQIERMRTLPHVTLDVPGEAVVEPDEEASTERGNSLARMLVNAVKKERQQEEKATAQRLATALVPGHERAVASAYLEARRAATAEHHAGGRRRPARDIAASALQVGRETAEALAFIFSPVVPEWVKNAVNAGERSPTAVARVLRRAMAANGGVLEDGEHLRELVHAIRRPRLRVTAQHGFPSIAER